LTKDIQFCFIMTKLSKGYNLNKKKCAARILAAHLEYSIIFLIGV